MQNTHSLKVGDKVRAKDGMVTRVEADAMCKVLNQLVENA